MVLKEGARRRDEMRGRRGMKFGLCKDVLQSLGRKVLLSEIAKGYEGWW
jgi:hypothetical protein